MYDFISKLQAIVIGNYFSYVIDGSFKGLFRFHHSGRRARGIRTENWERRAILDINRKYMLLLDFNLNIA